MMDRTMREGNLVAKYFDKNRVKGFLWKCVLKVIFG